MSDDYERLGLKKDANYEDLVKAYGEKSLELTNEADIAKLNESAAFIAKKIKELNQEKTTLPSGEEVTVEEIKKAIDEKINKVHIDYDNSVPKPRNRKINETDEEYEDYDAYAEDSDAYDAAEGEDDGEALDSSAYSQYMRPENAQVPKAEEEVKPLSRRERRMFFEGDENGEDDA